MFRFSKSAFDSVIRAAQQLQASLTVALRHIRISRPCLCRFEGNFTLWNHFRLNRTAAAETPERLAEIVTREADPIVEAWRAANAAAVPPGAKLPQPSDGR